MNNSHIVQERVFFTVIINVYNGVQLLHETLGSLIRQTFTGWELILWDDQSSDGSYEFCTSFQIEGKAVRCFQSNPKTTLAEARLNASRYAEGEWIVYLDQDDLWSPLFLEKIYRKIRASGPDTGAVYTRTQRFGADGRLGDFDVTRVGKKMPEGELTSALIKRPGFIATSAMSFKKTVIEQIDMIPSKVSLCPDYYFILFTSLAHKISVVDEYLCFYREHDGNMSHQIEYRVHQEILDIMNALLVGQKRVAFIRRYIVHQSLMALLEIRERNTFTAGLQRLLFRGSVLYLLLRCIIKGTRRLGA